jgi:hypothetical protein
MVGLTLEVLSEALGPLTILTATGKQALHKIYREWEHDRVVLLSADRVECLGKEEGGVLVCEEGL